MSESDSQQPQEQKHFTYETNFGKGGQVVTDAMRRALAAKVEKANAERYIGQVSEMSHVMPVRVQWDRTGEGQLVCGLFLVDLLSSRVFDSQGVEITRSPVAKDVLAKVKGNSVVEPLVPTDVIQELMKKKSDLIGRVPVGSQPPKPRHE